MRVPRLIQPPPASRRLAFAGLALVISLLVLAAGARAATVSVGAPTTAPPVPSGFVGLSFELTALESYAGHDPLALNPVFEQLVRNLAPGQRPVLRIGGDTTDWSWYPVPGMARPPWVRYTLTPGWLAVAHALTTALDARLILGVNLEANSTKIAATEARAVLNGIGQSSIDALELGNEPELYGSYNWYRTKAGVGVRGRGPGYTFPVFSRQFGAIARALPKIPLAGPAIGSPNWSSQLSPFLGANRQVTLATLHRYPLQRCAASTHWTAAELLAESSTLGLAASVAPYVRTARRFGDQLRIGEMNSVSCGGQPGLSNTFATALWSLDTLFAMANAGVAGVNFHTAPNAINQLFSFRDVGGRPIARVYPIYYGLAMFADAAPPGSRLLRTSGNTTGPIRAWATRGPDGHLRVVLINTRAAGGANVTVRVGSTARPATLARLTAPGLTAGSGVTLAGQGFGTATSTGIAVGAPKVTAVVPSAGGYRVSLPPASAALLTVA